MTANHPTAPPDTVRTLVYHTLIPFEYRRPRRIHVEEVLDAGYRKHRFGADDRRFGTYLAYGVLRHWFRLEQVIAQLSRIPLEKIDPPIRLLLRMGIFQLACMHQVPDYAAVNTTMELAASLHVSQKGRGFLHALLQNHIRRGKPWLESPEAGLPGWWMERLGRYYSSDEVSQITKAASRIPLLSIRVNTLKTTVEAYHRQLENAGLPIEASQTVPEILWFTAPAGDPQELPGYDDGLFLVQDESSARVARFLDPQPDETVLEIGAAPGTKTTHLAALMQNRGRIIAVDNAQSRMARLGENCRRLGVTIAEPHIRPGENLDCTDFSVDRVLIDAPCSGTGTIGKHPEILITLREDAFRHFSELQLRLMESGFRCLKPQGVMVYSTCSIDPAENDAVVRQFLDSHSHQAHLKEALQILPDTHRDGFYMARIQKVQEN